MKAAQKDGAGSLQCRAALKKEKARKVEALVAGRRIPLHEQFRKLLAMDHALDVSTPRQDHVFVRVHRLDVRAKTAQDVAVPPTSICLRQHRLKPLHEGAQKRAASCEESPRQVFDLGQGKLKKVLFPDLDEYHDDDNGALEI